VFPTSKCKLRLLKLERIKDYLLMEQEFIQNQELRKPREEQNDVKRCSDRFNLFFFSPVYYACVERQSQSGRSPRHTDDGWNT
jgi:hypothetical protein